MSHAEDWRLVAQWLVKMRVLPQTHKAAQLSGTVIDLGASLRDGVCLCRLLTILNPNSLTLSEYNAHPYNSEFMASRNIMKFLSVCKNFFKLSERELFQVDDLLSLRNFGKVLITLSLLSRSPLVLTGPTTSLNLVERDRKQDNDYYRFTDDGAAAKLDEYTTEEDVYDFENDTGEDIYASVVHRTEPGRKRQPSATNATSALESVLAEPKTKREHCLREIIEKEANYVQALSMLQKNFIVPLREKLRADVRDIIFKHIEDLQQFHETLLTQLNQALLIGRSSLVPEIFIQSKMCFVVYGNYCTNLPDAQAKIEEVCRDPSVADEITKCEQLDAGKFKLGELLTVPMQRILKYPLLLNELSKQSVKEPTVTPEELERIKLAIEAMQDIAAFINECKRDKENTRTVDDIQKGISDLEIPEGTTLHNYGRMCKDGELRIYKHGAAKTNSPRYVFLFEKVLLICKRTGSERFFGGQTYAFKDAISLENYELEEPSPSRAKNNDRWSAPFYIKPKDADSRDFAVYTLYAKSDVERLAWIKRINEAIEKISPEGATAHGRMFVYTTFTEPTVCHVCLKLLRGAFYQGYHCERTGVDAHKECVCELAKNKFYDVPAPILLVQAAAGQRRSLQLPSILNPPTSANSSHSALVRDNINSVIPSRARRRYNGNPLPPGSKDPLMFQENELVEITLAPLNSDWLEGRIGDRKGWFPRDCVEMLQSSEIDAAGVPARAMAQANGADRQVRAGSVSSSMNAGNGISNKLSVRGGTGARAAGGSNSNLDQQSQGINRSSSSVANSFEQLSLHRGPSTGAQINDPSAFRIAPDHELATFAWFVGEMDRKQAADLLRDRYPGTFLVRESLGPQNEFAISLQYRSTVKHMRIFHSDSPTGIKWFLCDQRLFDTVPELVNFYEVNSLNSAFSDVDCTLAYPCRERIESFAIALYDYNTAETGKLSFVEKDRIAVISKAADDRGWWKGRLNGRAGYFPKSYVREED